MLCCLCCLPGKVELQRCFVVFVVCMGKPWCRDYVLVSEMFESLSVLGMKSTLCQLGMKSTLLCGISFFALQNILRRYGKSLPDGGARLREQCSQLRAELPLQLAKEKAERLQEAAMPSHQMTAAARMVPERPFSSAYGQESVASGGRSHQIAIMVRKLDTVKEEIFVWNLIS